MDSFVCTRCVYDASVPNIEFDDAGVCNYCKQIDELVAQYGTGSDVGQKRFDEILGQIKKAGQNKRYDCVIGVSGGTDSSYLIMKAVSWGLRPLAVHYDNTWNSAIATMNIEKVTREFNVDLYTHVVNNKEIDDIKRSLVFSGIREIDADTDIALAQTMRAAAAKYNIKYILEGHSFVTEGILPPGDIYFDGAYVANIHKRYGKISAKSFPNLTFWQFMKWVILYRQKFIRPFWYIDYDKEKAREELIRKVGWEYYGGHHLENAASSFTHKIWLPERFNTDFRNLTLAADVRNAKITREAAIKEYNSEKPQDQELKEFFLGRLNISLNEYDEIKKLPDRTWRDFKTYKKRFESLRFLFKILADAEMIPRSFYLKYCFPIPKKVNRDV